MKKKYLALILLVFVSSSALLYFFMFKQYLYYETRPSSEIAAEVLVKIQSGHFREVEEFIDDLVRRKPFSIDGTRLLEDIYEILSWRRDILESVNEWCGSAEPHHAAFIIRGNYHIQQAWRERGGGYAYTVSDEMSRLYKEQLFLAKEDLEKAYAIEPKDPNSSAKMISVCKGLSMGEEIMDQWFQNAIESDPCALDAYIEKIHYLLPKWHGTDRKVSEFAERCYRFSPDHSIVYMAPYIYILEKTVLAEDRDAFLEQKDMRFLVNDLFNRWERDFPNSPLYQTYKGWLEDYRGSRLFAIYLYGNALERDPNYHLALRSRAISYWNTGEIAELDKVEKDYKKILSINPYSDFALFGLGDISCVLYHDELKAIEYYSRAIDLNCRKKLYFLRRAESKSSMKVRNHNGAIEDYSAAIALDRRYIEAYFNRGLCYKSLNQLERAKEDFRKVEQLIAEESIKGAAAAVSEERAKRILKVTSRLLNSHAI